MIANDQIRNLFLALNDMKYALKYGADMLGLAWDLRCARIGATVRPLDPRQRPVHAGVVIYAASLVEVRRRDAIKASRAQRSYMILEPMRTYSGPHP